MNSNVFQFDNPMLQLMLNLELEALKQMYLSSSIFSLFLEDAYTLTCLSEHHAIYTKSYTFADYVVNYLIKYLPSKSLVPWRVILDAAFDYDDDVALVNAIESFNAQLGSGLNEKTLNIEARIPQFLRTHATSNIERKVLVVYKKYLPHVMAFREHIITYSNLLELALLTYPATCSALLADNMLLRLRKLLLSLEDAFANVYIHDVNVYANIVVRKYIEAVVWSHLTYDLCINILDVMIDSLSFAVRRNVMQMFLAEITVRDRLDLLIPMSEVKEFNIKPNMPTLPTLASVNIWLWLEDTFGVVNIKTPTSIKPIIGNQKTYYGRAVPLLSHWYNQGRIDSDSKESELAKSIFEAVIYTQDIEALAWMIEHDYIYPRCGRLEYLHLTKLQKRMLKIHNC